MTSISFRIEEIENQNENSEFNIEELIAGVEKTELENNDVRISHVINYQENCTVKELLTICEYYGFAKDVKNNKLNKEQIIEVLVAFELDPNNSDIVFKRQNMWFYINELKNDKFMKKYVFW